MPCSEIIPTDSNSYFVIDKSKLVLFGQLLLCRIKDRATKNRKLQQKQNLDVKEEGIVPGPRLIKLIVRA